MWSWRRSTVGVLTLALIGAGITVATAPADAAITVRLRAGIEKLPVKSETRAGYQREKFKHWIDSDKDCQDTRSEVLRAESLINVALGCAVTIGRWRSAYDGLLWTLASDVDIDHMVPLAEAWDSGAKTWNASTRQAFANDLGDKRTLVAVTDNVNQAKGDKDPAQWLPPRQQCSYVKQWVAVKLRWRLAVDPAEKAALHRVAGGCKNAKITVTKAKVAKGSNGGPVATPRTTPRPNIPTPNPGSGLDPRYSTCTAAKAAGYGPYIQGRDPEYAWYDDRDNDGIVCE